MRVNQKYIEKIFYSYDKIKRAVEEAKSDPASNRTGGNSSGHAWVSDPTANVAIRAATPIAVVVIETRKGMESDRIREPEKWLRVVEATYEYFDGKLAGAVTKRRFSGEDYRKTCQDLCISQNIYYCITRDVSHYAQLCAVGLGLMTPFREEVIKN